MPSRLSDRIIDVAQRAHTRFNDFELSNLPRRLRRNSLDYYYLSVWPGLAQLDPIDEGALPERTAPVQSAYIHLPFCSGLCDFCSYFVLVSHDPAKDPRIREHVEDLLREVDLHVRSAELEISYLYLGGGTPSLLSPDNMARLLGGLHEREVLADELLGTVELHPEFFRDASRAYAFLETLRAYGIHRISVGFQTDDDGLLSSANRRHDSYFASEAVNMLLGFGFIVNLDLMYGLPGQSLGSWIGALDTAVALKPDSLSTYFTFIDPGTRLSRQIATRDVELPGHELVQTQHLAAQIALEEAGFHELPNDFWCTLTARAGDFVQETLPSEANSLGLGAGAYGYYSGLQYFNHFNLGDYRRALDREELPVWRGRLLTPTEQQCRDVMFSLKNSPYLDLSLFAARHEASATDTFAAQFDEMLGLDLVVIDSHTVRLTRKGRLLVEEIACLFEPAGHHATRELPTTEVHRIRRHNFAPTYSAPPGAR